MAIGDDSSHFYPINELVENADLVDVSCYVSCAEAIWLADIARTMPDENMRTIGMVISRLIAKAYNAGRP